MPIDRSVVLKLIDDNIKDLKTKLGLERWSLKFNCEPSGTDNDGSVSLGSCYALIDYEDARIDLNPAAFDDTKHALSTLRHELFHILLAPLDLYMEAVDELEISEGEKKMLKRIWNHSLEKTILNLQRMYNGLTAPDADSLQHSDPESGPE